MKQILLRNPFITLCSILIAVPLLILFIHWYNMNTSRVDIDETEDLMAVYKNYLPENATIGFTGDFKEEMELNRICFQSQFSLAPRIITKDTAVCDTLFYVAPLIAGANPFNLPDKAQLIYSHQNHKYTSVLYRKIRK
jgi:hypothetical protein